ncbi:hypothetical protein K2173_010466 [Erythroxylum novogranatense]|uniref:Uncharacterized protein n=1 Tax=Erythroxylum novogranatense TaxID=1862640 RepID=A0AAV8TDP9_9ROSI|nr:hypothetical protein K2173_010466 [Erythroxylum novogranatense]
MSSSSSSVCEAIDAKEEAGKDTLPTQQQPNDDNNDADVVVEPNAPPLPPSHEHQPVKNSTHSADDEKNTHSVDVRHTLDPSVNASVPPKLDDQTKKDDQSHSQSLGEKLVQLPDHKNLEGPPFVELTANPNATQHIHIQPTPNEAHRNNDALEFKSTDNVQNAANESGLSSDTSPKLELNQTSSEAKPEVERKGEQSKDACSFNDKFMNTKANDGDDNDPEKETPKDLLPTYDKPLESKDKDDEEGQESMQRLSAANAEESDTKVLKDDMTKNDLSMLTTIKQEHPKSKLEEGHKVTMKTPNNSFPFEPSSTDGYESGTEQEQAAFMMDVEAFYRENHLEFKAPKFYKEELNLLKLWRAVIKLGGYEQVTSCKLWRQVGESFRPPKTCTTVSWTFRIFYEKALLEYEKHKIRTGELSVSDSLTESAIRFENQAAGSETLGSGRQRRDAATRAMQGWHSQRLLGNGQVCHPIIKDKNLNPTPKIDKQLKTNGLLKRKRATTERDGHVSHMKTLKQQGDTMVIDIGTPADWVKINVQRTNECFEVYALVPGLLREEVHVQSDPAGRLIISGEPEQLDNPWGVTPFKKVVSLPARIDPHQTSAVVTLHGQLFVRVPFEQSGL